MVFFMNHFSLDYEGYVKQINHSIPQRDSFFSIDVGQVDEWYSSLKIFVDLLYENAIYFKTEPGLLNQNNKDISNDYRCCRTFNSR